MKYLLVVLLMVVLLLLKGFFQLLFDYRVITDVKRKSTRRLVHNFYRNIVLVNTVHVCNLSFNIKYICFRNRLIDCL